MSRTRTPTFGLLAISLFAMALTASAQIGGTGWTPKTLNFKVQSPTNAAQSLRYWFTNNIYHCLTYSNDGAFSVGNTTLPRTEQRFNPDYTNGEIHYQAMFNVPGNENSYSIFQIHTGDALSSNTNYGSTTFMAFWFTNNNGSVHDYSGTTLATNLAGKWFQLNFDHNIVTRTIRVWINQKLVWTQQDNGAGDFYIKDGVYEQNHGPTLQMDTSISNILEWTSSGTNPPAGPTGLTATQSSALIKLAWNNSVGATNYNVKRATNSAGPFNVLANTTATNYTDLTAALGPTYYYVVSALDAFGESTNSSKASIALDPGYQLSATPLTQTVNYGNNSNFTVNITTNSFFKGTTILSASGAPPGITANLAQISFSQSGSTTLSVQTTPGTSPGTYPLTIAGTNGSFFVTTNVIFTVLSPHPLMSVPTTLPDGRVVLSGSGGVPGGSYYVFVSTNLALPSTQWTAIATDSFDSNGAFNYTNVQDPNSPQLYYRLQTP